MATLHLGETRYSTSASRLGGVWRLAGVIAVVPRAVRDPLYRWIARYRYRCFGTTACHVPTEEERARFLEQTDQVGLPDRHPGLRRDDGVAAQNVYRTRV